MAKRNNSRISAGGGLIALVAILLIAVIVCGVITHGFKDWTTCGCFGHKYDDNGVCVRCGEDKPKEDDKAITDSVVLGGSQGNGMVMASAKLLNSQYDEYGISAQAESAYTLTATIEPEDASNKRVDWKVEYADGTTDDVEDYVTVTPTYDGSLTANVECIKAFGKQIVITVTSRDNEEITASCTVDYRKRVVSTLFYITLNYGGGPEMNAIYYGRDNTGAVTTTKNKGITFDFTDSSANYYMDVSVTYSAGTLDCEDEITLTYGFAQPVYNYLGQAGAHTGTTCSNNTCQHVVDTKNPKTITVTGRSNRIAFNKDLLTQLSLWTGESTSVQSRKFNYLANAFESVSEDFAFTVTCGDYSRTYSMNVNTSSMSIKVTDLSLSEGALVF